MKNVSQYDNAICKYNILVCINRTQLLNEHNTYATDICPFNKYCCVLIIKLHL